MKVINTNIFYRANTTHKTGLCLNTSHERGRKAEQDAADYLKSSFNLVFSKKKSSCWS